MILVFAVSKNGRKIDNKIKETLETISSRVHMTLTQLNPLAGGRKYGKQQRPVLA
jgi:hypothetical protein